MVRPEDGDGPSWGELSDRILSERASDGDELAFGEIVRRHSGLMRAYTARIVGSVADADDVVQEAFVIAWKQLPNLRDGAALKAWLMKIAGREAFAFLRRRGNDQPLDGIDIAGAESTNPEHVAVHTARLAALSRALDRLPEAQRTTWLLREVGGFSYDEIAEQTDLPVSTVRGNLARARSGILIQMEGWR
ncbi:RNA polymerase sigma factor [Microbacterium sp. P05]|uniref:RNA polymerase sigma factor n=1 Tax=Microbacterium sp. P05 TaxID=3366948 RepID=UPI00374781C8